MLTLLNDRTPIEQFDVTGPFEFTEQVLTLDELHQTALANRPDLKAAMQAVDKAKTDYRLAVANGTTDPTFGMDLARNPPIPAYIGFSVTVPLRIFDRNQGKRRGRNWTSGVTSGSRTPTRRRCSATPIPPSPR